jgi:hypothetical protein
MSKIKKGIGLIGNIERLGHVVNYELGMEPIAIDLNSDRDIDAKIEAINKLEDWVVAIDEGMAKPVPLDFKIEARYIDERKPIMNGKERRRDRRKQERKFKK